MKKMLKSASLACLAVAFVLPSCNYQSTEDITVTPSKIDSETQDVEKALVKINVRNIISKARTLLPSFDASKLTNLTLSGSLEGKDKEVLGGWENISDNTSITIPIGKWSFTLSAEISGTYFTGDAITDIVNGTNTVNFELSNTNYGQKGIGSLHYDISYPLRDSISAKASLVSTKYEEIEEYTNLELTSSNNDTITTTTINLNEVKAGNYLVKLDFYDNNIFVNTLYFGVIVAPDCETNGSESIPSIASSYSITVDLDGGTIVEGSIPSFYSPKSETIVLPTNLTKEGYIFKGWINNNGESITSIMKGSKGNISLTALWAEVIPEPETKFVIGISQKDISLTVNSIENIITAEATKGYDSYEWLLDGEVLNNTEDTLTKDLSSYEEGYYQLTVIATKNDITYSDYIFVNVLKDTETPSEGETEIENPSNEESNGETGDSEIDNPSNEESSENENPSEESEDTENSTIINPLEGKIIIFVKAKSAPYIWCWTSSSKVTEKMGYTYKAWPQMVPCETNYMNDSEDWYMLDITDYYEAGDTITARIDKESNEVSSTQGTFWYDNGTITYTDPSASE